jgi:hypothetical protein
MAIPGAKAGRHPAASPFPPSADPRGVAAAEKAVYGFLLSVLIVFSAFYFYHAARIILFPFSVDYGEGFLLGQGKNLAAFEGIYDPIDASPWLVSNYPPLYPMVVAMGVKLFGTQFYFGRVVSLAGVLVAGFCLYRMTLLQTMSRLAAWIAMLAWFASYPIYDWGTHHRVDSLGIGLEALGLLFLLRRERLKMAAAFFLLALFTRQTILMGPLAGYFFLRRMDGPRAAAKWLGGLLFVGAALFGAISLLTQGEFFRHLVVYNANEYNLKDVWRMFHGAVMSPMQFPTLFAIYYLVRTSVSGKWDLPSLCIPFSALSLFFAGKLGSATNYLFELAFASSWAIGMVLAEGRFSIPQSNPVRLFAPLILGVGVLFPLHVPHLYGQWEIYDWGGTPISSSAVLSEELSARLSEIPPPVLSQDSGMALLSGQEVLWQPFVMTQLAKDGVWDPAPLYASIRAKKYSALVLPIDLDRDPDAWSREEWWTQLTPELAKIVRENYRVDPRLKRLPPDISPDADPRLLRGYPSPYWTNYLYLPR